MGCCWFCKDPVKESWFDQYKAEKFNGHTLEVISGDYFEEVVRLFAHSFGGTPTTQPEHATRWVMGKKHEGEWPSTNDLVRDYMEWAGELVAYMAFGNGIIVGIKDEDDSLMAMAIIYPRGHAPDMSTCAVMGIICGNMNCSSIPSMDKENFPGAAERGEELMKSLDTKVYKECVYLGTLAVDPKHQGKGLGKALLRFVCEVATREKTFAYLEADGPRNPSIYRKFGFVHETVAKMLDPTGAEDPADLHLMKTDNPPDLSRFGSI